jgi:DNA-binding GntR family transcriptional regulator
MPVPVVAEPISRVPTRETVAGTLRAWIVDGTLAPEEVLRDADIARAFGISRTPVREALLHLEHEGLVESQPGRWTRVTPLDPTRLVNLFPVWTELEALVGRLAAAAGSVPHETALEDAALAFATAVDAALTDPGTMRTRVVREADACFHDALLAAAHNPLLTGTLIPLRLTVRRYEIACPRAFVPDAEAVDDHAAILAAIQTGDGDAAADAARVHVRHTHQHLCAGWDLSAAN